MFINKRMADIGFLAWVKIDKMGILGWWFCPWLKV
jgi:hypothetical protein